MASLKNPKAKVLTSGKIVFDIGKREAAKLQKLVKAGKPQKINISFVLRK